MLSKLALPLLALAGGVAAQQDLPPITMKGQKFFFPNGTQFFMKGVAYQQDTAAGGGTTTQKEDFVDPLADVTRCREDIPLLAELGTNTIRTYAINPEADHTVCMNLLQENGIYVVSDLGQPQLSINRDDPEWNTELFARYKDVVDEMGRFSNVIGFFAGNEVSNNKTNTEASAYVKAAVRDTKAYIAENSDRWMGVGYAANDDPDIRIDIAHYFNCGPEESAIDFWGYNIYSWCGESNLQDSGYLDQADFFRNYSVPVFFAEYGCNNDGAANRIFEETGALYEDEMTEVFSGGIVYMYFQEANDYGLVKVTGGEAVPNDGFEHLADEHRAADPNGVQEDEYSPDLTPAECPTISEVWKVSSELPPVPDEQLCDCMMRASPCVRADNLDLEDYADIFDFICSESESICSAINGNATAGIYGAYSMCSRGAKLDYVLGAYYDDQDGASDACDFDGGAQTQDVEEASSCSDILDAAESINDQVATATSPVGGASETGDSGDDSEDDDDSAALPGSAIAHVFAVGDFAVGLYMLVAVGVGGAMVAL